ncbi:hypothetical protein KEM52_004994 [Ascosphaera acerosa]|nr:hypothetical protein KEM52_004994 [Ascosphaera acerosa]
MPMFGVTGFGLGTLKYFANGRKNPRRAIDTWDKVCRQERWEKGRPHGVAGKLGWCVAGSLTC